MSMKNNNTPGPDSIQVEILNIMCETIPSFLDLLTKAIQRNIRHWRNSRSLDAFHTKESNAKTCHQHQLISLINHLSKIFTKVIQNRIYEKWDSDSQFDFNNALCTRDSICFIDFANAFDSVNNDLLISILKKVGLDSKNIRMIANLYWRV